MKKIFIILVTIFSCSVAKSQDLIKELQKLTLANDSLQKQVVKPLNDSIVKLNKNLVFNNNQLDNYIKEIYIEREKNIALQQKNDDLNDNKVKKERDSLQHKVDSLFKSINDLTILLSSKESEIVHQKELAKSEAADQFNKGRQEVYNKLIITYGKPFEELLKTQNLYVIQRDKQIIFDDKQVQQKLFSLEVYYKAEMLLSEKYNEGDVEVSIKQLKSIEQVQNVKNLIERLSNYKLWNDALKETIVKISDIDKSFIANDADTQSKKNKNIFGHIAWYVSNYNSDPKSYPFITSILFEIINIKQVDANSDLSIILNKL